jgi:hypothetical protein
VLNAYSTGAWVTSSDQLDGDSFDLAHTTSLARITDGYIGAGFLGGANAQTQDVRQAVYDWLTCSDADLYYSGGRLTIMLPPIATPTPFAHLSPQFGIDASSGGGQNFQQTVDSSQVYTSIVWKAGPQSDGFLAAGQLDNAVVAARYAGAKASPTFVFNWLRDLPTIVDVVERKRDRFSVPMILATFPAPLQYLTAVLGQELLVDHWSGVSDSPSGWVGQRTKLMRSDIDLDSRQLFLTVQKVHVAATTTAVANVTTLATIASQALTFDVTVTNDDGGGANGSVTVTVKTGGGATVGTPVTVSVLEGSAAVAYTLPANTDPAAYVIQAVYAGDAYTAASTGTGTLTLTDTAFITAVNISGSSLRSNFTGCVGYQFTPVVNMRVTAVGRWIDSGNSGTHTVKVLRHASPAFVASASINTSGATAGQHKYASVTPVTLLAGALYTLWTQETNGGDQWQNYPVLLTSTADGIVNGSNNSDSSCTAADPGGTFSPETGKSYAGPSFRYTK